MKANKRIRDLRRRSKRMFRTYVVTEGNKYYVTTDISPDVKLQNRGVHYEDRQP